MVRRRKIIVIEEADRKAPVTPGYAPSGESSFTRHAAQGHAVDTTTRDRHSFSRLDSMCIHERREIAKLEARTVAARGTPKHAMLCVKLQRLRHFLARLEAEQRELAP